MIFYLLGLLSYYKAIKKPVPIGICLAFFGMLAVPPVITLYFLINKHWVFQLIAFVSGLICWTFIEYFVHRFWLHKKEDRYYYTSHHFLHYTQPKKIFTKAARRVAITMIAISLLTGSILYSNYLFLPAGISAGYALYENMHVWLHQPWSSQWFGNLQKFHIQHHCVQTEKCFGVTFTWWDRIFNTSLTSDKMISEKARKIYFKGNELKENL